MDDANLVLIPGYMLDGEMWVDVEDRLARLASLSHADLSRDATLERMADRILETAPERFALIGFSMGGYVAREVVQRAPDRVSALILIATSSRGDSEVAARRKATVARIADVKFTGLSRSAIASSFAPGPVAEETIALVRAMGERLGAAAFQRQSGLVRVSDRDRLVQIQCPTLIVAGAADQLRRPEEARELHEGIVGSTLVVIEGSGHMIPLERPEQLSSTIANWLGGLGWPC